jgi:hypothetical protein
LFSGFVFLYAGDEERAAALATGRITTILDVADQDELHKDLAHVETMLSQSQQLAAPSKQAGCRGNADQVKQNGQADGKNRVDGDHSQSGNAERSLVLSVRFLRQNIMIETNGTHQNGAASEVRL